MTAASTSTNGAGIGGGEEATKQGTLSSYPNGNAWIVASSVGAKTDSFNGVIFDESDGGNGKVYGSATISGDGAIPTGKTLTVKDGGHLDASKGEMENNGDIENDGDVKLPETMKPEEIKDLGITGTGTIELGDKTDGLWNARADQDLTVYIEVDFDGFANAVSLDDVALASNDFGAREGSTIVTI